MKLGDFTVSWVDFAVLLIVLAGIFRGRKRGMSEELLDTIKWVGILVVAAVFHRPLGEWLANSTMFSLLACYIFVYTMIIVIFKVIFAFVRRQIGDKLVSSDFFGSAEYYLGMVAGGFRYTCAIIVALAFINARYYSPEELTASRNFQETNFGDIRFPTFAGFQSQVFGRSVTGKLATDFLWPVLIPSTPPEQKDLAGANNVVRAREKQIDQIR
ncbi:MAG: CvpA family protein [Verrucomicrobia subdivision 3 bacterium]|nr:CvpA family protein [Limisphaerales bacterium]